MTIDLERLIERNAYRAPELGVDITTDEFAALIAELRDLRQFKSDRLSGWDAPPDPDSVIERKKKEKP